MEKQRKLVDADKAKFFIADILDTFDVPIGNKMANRLLDLMDDLPAVDAVEVVRCKKCECRGDPVSCPMCHEDCDGELVDYTTDNSFCSFG